MFFHIQAYPGLFAFYVIKESQILYISHIVAKILDCRYHHDLGVVKVSGCGMDMCFNTVYQVAFIYYLMMAISSK